MWRYDDEYTSSTAGAEGVGYLLMVCFAIFLVFKAVELLITHTPKLAKFLGLSVVFAFMAIVFLGPLYTIIFMTPAENMWKGFLFFAFLLAVPLAPMLLTRGAGVKKKTDECSEPDSDSQ